MKGWTCRVRAPLARIHRRSRMLSRRVFTLFQPSFLLVFCSSCSPIVPASFVREDVRLDWLEARQPMDAFACWMFPAILPMECLFSLLWFKPRDFCTFSIDPRAFAGGMGRLEWRSAGGCRARWGLEDFQAHSACHGAKLLYVKVKFEECVFGYFGPPCVDV